ncbi:alpha/beta hydrolase [Mesorhizobium sp. B1-1-8]|uniref:alpha/beta hydrolase n=1 Tax=Mesorhizobium sp. B1-1-8 TaxID=2589976 RepID=UPI0011283F97|nr:alpha/beta-hydrolase family protein [Mesorhizobium sp. B1-1-8]UCI05664.1 alpha/beta-hydrolase family protein [Mesorhizobium sp. B1-1-8]
MSYSRLGLVAQLITIRSRLLSGSGLVVGTFFFAAALRPTLIPRTDLTQGVLAGGCFAAGYGLGVALQWLWRYLQIPELATRPRRLAKVVIIILCLCGAIASLWESANWQNSIRAAMQMPLVDGSHPLNVCALAIVTFVSVLAIARLLSMLVQVIAQFFRRYIPRRLANVAGVGIAAVLAWSVASNVVVSSVFSALDSSYAKYDALFEPKRLQPAESSRTGSSASLVRWDELGRAGREFIADEDTAAEISTFTGRPAQEAIRVYVGLGAASNPEARAKLALEELKRVGGFRKSTMIIITPTGTGWVDPASMDAVEYLCRGDVASVAVQYSYLSSPLSLLAQPEYGSETARALFLEIYGYWTTLPKQSRPRLYLHGLSLGAMNSEKSVGLFEIIDDPISGALWSGPPFDSRVWRSVSDARNKGTPQWLPVFRDSSLVRFMNQSGQAVPRGAPWGPLRVVYLQYASDPIVFFDYRDAYRQPSWMNSPRGPDVSAQLSWYPIVTMLQLGLDMAVATTAPIGHGHVYAPQDYVEGWSAVLGVQDWGQQDLFLLKEHLAAKIRAKVDDRGG